MAHYKIAELFVCVFTFADLSIAVPESVSVFLSPLVSCQMNNNKEQSSSDSNVRAFGLLWKTVLYVLLQIFKKTFI